ncbi:arylamine N-acetyltransferase / N-hydroxyarylamine O-acetyltransferase-like [Amblyomma americanum]
MEPLPEQAVQDYLEYLGVIRPVEPNLDHLNTLIRAHLERVPFENVDSLLGRDVFLDTKAVLTKVLKGRGGYCYELNCLFGRLLEALGYRVLPCPARFRIATSDDSPAKTRLSHVALLVQLPDGGDRLVDIGVAFIGMERALPLKGGNTKPFLIREVGNSGALDVCVPTKSGGWKVSFTVEPYDFDWEDFVPLNWLSSTLPESHVRHELFVGRRCVDDGCWLQLVNDQFIRWSPNHGIVEKRVLKNEDEIVKLLRTVFRLGLSPEDDIGPLHVRLREVMGSWRQDGKARGKKRLWPDC